MNLTDWMRRHRACDRGVGFVERLGGATKTNEEGVFGHVWNQTYRGDWHCWLLDSLLCPFQDRFHAKCLLIYNREMTGWWTAFEVLRKRHKVGSSLDNYLKLDNREGWTRETLVTSSTQAEKPGGRQFDAKSKAALDLDKRKAALWMESAALMREAYRPLWLAGVQAVLRYTSPF